MLQLVCHEPLFPTQRASPPITSCLDQVSPVNDSSPHQQWKLVHRRDCLCDILGCHINSSPLTFKEIVCVVSTHFNLLFSILVQLMGFGFVSVEMTCHEMMRDKQNTCADKRQRELRDWHVIHTSFGCDFPKCKQC